MDKFGVQFASLVEALLGEDQALWLRFRAAYAEAANIRGRSKGVREKRAGTDLYRMLRTRSRPGSKKAWLVFESLRVAGIAWCSGILGLYAAGHIKDIVGALDYARPVWDHDWDSLERLTAVIENARYALNFEGEETNRTGIESIEIRNASRSACELDSETHRIVEQGFLQWSALRSHEIGSISRRNLSFPAEAYLIASNEDLDLRIRCIRIFTDFFWMRWVLSDSETLHADDPIPSVAESNALIAELFP